MSAGKGQSGSLAAYVNERKLEKFAIEEELHASQNSSPGTSSSVNSVRQILDESVINVRVDTYVGKEDKSRKKWLPDSPSTVFCKEEGVIIQVKSDKDGYLYVLYQDSNEEITLLHPCDVDHKDGRIKQRIEDVDNSIKASQTVTIPEEGFVIHPTPPYGKTEVLLAIVTSKPLKPEKLRALAKKSVNGMTSNDVAELCKGMVLSAIEPDNNIDSLFDEPETGEVFEYGACRLFTTTFETKEEKQSYLSKPRTVFVGIGIDKYKADNLNFKLDACVKDVTSMADTLQKLNVIEAENTILLKNEEATIENIKYLFVDFLPAYMLPDDKLIVHWSSHGAKATKKGSDKPEMYFASHDTNDVFDRVDISTMIASDELNKWVNGLRVSNILFIIDSCYAGGAIDPDFDWLSNFSSYQKGISGDNVSIIASSNKNEPSLINPETYTSIMSGVLIDYFKLDHKSDIKVSSIGPAIKDKVGQISVEQLNLNQTVNYVTGKKGDFVLIPKQ